MVDFFYSSTSNCSLFVIVLVIQLFWMLMFMILSSLGWLVKYYELGSHIWASNFILKIGAPFVFSFRLRFSFSSTFLSQKNIHYFISKTGFLGARPFDIWLVQLLTWWRETEVIWSCSISLESCWKLSCHHLSQCCLCC